MKFPALTAGLLVLAVFASPVLAQDAQQDDQAGQPQLDHQPPLDIGAFLQDQRRASELSTPELRKRIRAGRAIIQNDMVPLQARHQVQLIVREAKLELRSRMANGGGQADNGNGQPTDEAQDGGAPQESADGQPAGQSPNVGAFIGDERPLNSLSDSELKQRFNDAVKLQQAKDLSPETKQQLQQIAKAARSELAIRKPKPSDQSSSSDQQATNQAKTGDQGANNQPKPEKEVLPIGTQVPDDVVAFIGDPRVDKDLSDDELSARLKSARKYANDASLPQNIRDKSQAIAKAARIETQARSQTQTNGEQTASNQPPVDQPATKPLDNAKGDPAAEAKARTLIDDQADPAKLSDADLRGRLNSVRELLAANKLSKESETALGQKLKVWRDALRQRVASKEEQAPGAGNAGKNVTDVTVVLTDKRPSEQLSDAELGRRIDVYRDAALSDKYDPGQRDQYRIVMNQDRQVLHQRLITERQKRQADLSQKFQKGQLNINLGITLAPGAPPPPRSVFAAEVDDTELQDVLEGPPRRTIDRRYTLQEVEASPDLRDALPRIEIDTIHFGFGESFVREEEVGNLDRIAEIMERILAAHPREVFIIEGHTDAVGSDEANLQLSRARAEAIKQALVGYYVIPPDNLVTVGYGERYLKIPTPEPEVENRRVSIARGTPLVGELGE